MKQAHQPSIAISEQHVIDENTFLRNNIIASPNRYEPLTNSSRKHISYNLPTSAGGGGYEADLEPAKPNLNASYHAGSKKLLLNASTGNASTMLSPEITLVPLIIDLQKEYEK